MMTKTKSGFPARLKAMLVIPFAITVFLLFADFTLKGPGSIMLDLNSVLASRNTAAELNGLWLNKSEDGFSQMLHFTGDRFAFLEGKEISEFYWSLQKGELVLSAKKETEGIHLRVESGNDELGIWWNDSKLSTYHKVSADNTLDLFLGKQEMRLELPVISQFRLMEEQTLLFRLCLGYTADGGTALSFNGLDISIEDLPVLLARERNQFSKLDQGKLTAMLFVDKEMPMQKVVELKEKLRSLNSLKIADAGYPYSGTSIVKNLQDPNLQVSPLQYHTVGLPRLLPPADMAVMEKDKARKQGMEIFEINLSARNTSPGQLDQDLEKFIRELGGQKYVFSLEYDGKISYGQYLESVDMVFRVVYRFRNELAMEKHKVSYGELGTELQKEIRAAYPMVLSEAWNN